MMAAIEHAQREAALGGPAGDFRFKAERPLQSALPSCPLEFYWSAVIVFHGVGYWLLVISPAPNCPAVSSVA